MPRRVDSTRMSTIALAAIALATACARDAGVRTDRIAIPSPALAGSVIANAAEQPALVLLPPSYASTSRSYPVIYFLPGFTTDAAEFIDGSLEGLDLRSLLAAYFAGRPDAEAIVVIVHGRNALGGSFYVNSAVTGRWEDHLVADLVPSIEARYRTIRDRRARLLAGEGMGGFGALHVAMRRPETFGAVYAIGPDLFDETGLEDSGMLRPALAKAWDIENDRMSRWPAAEAPRRLVEFRDELHASGNRFDYAREFAYAYGAAFAPDPAGGPPFIAFPVRGTASAAVTDSGLLRRWREGYGGWEEKIARHREELRALAAIGIDVAAGDRRAWVARGGRHVATLLHDAGIEVGLTERDGDHYERLAESIEKGLLPFYSGIATEFRTREPR